MLQQSWFYKENMKMFYDDYGVQFFYDTDNGMVYTVEDCAEGTRIIEHDGNETDAAYSNLKVMYDMWVEDQEYDKGDKEKIYDRICSTLTDFEKGKADANDLYGALVMIQNRWEDTITVSE